MAIKPDWQAILLAATLGLSSLVWFLNLSNHVNNNTNQIKTLIEKNESVERITDENYRKILIHDFYLREATEEKQTDH